MKTNMLCLQTDPVILWENIKGGKLLCGALYDKLLKKKVSQISLQK